MQGGEQTGHPVGQPHQRIVARRQPDADLQGVAVDGLLELAQGFEAGADARELVEIDGLGAEKGVSEAADGRQQE